MNFILGYGVLSGDADWQMWDHYHSKAMKRTFYNNPEVDRLLDAARETFDQGKVRELYYQAQEIVWDECPWIFLYEQPDICAINKKLKNWTGRRDECYLFRDASLAA
jgi:peptide/nickel transport system substrate-binding protein